MRRFSVGLASALALLTLVGCTGTPRPPAEVGATSATLKADARVDDGDNPVSWWWQIATTPSGLGPANPTGATSRCLVKPTNVPSGTYNGIGCKVTGLTPNTTYFYRFCGSTAKISPTCIPTVQEFATAPDCDDTKAPSETVNAFVESNPPGTSSNRQVLCLPGGAYSLDGDEMDLSKDYQTLTAAPLSDGSGRRQAVELDGNVGIEGPVGVTLSDLKVVGCWNADDFPDPDCEAGVSKVVDVKGNNATVRNLDITTARRSESIQGLMVGGIEGVDITGAKILENKIHTLGYSRSDHAIYFSTKASGNEVAGDWHWDIPGFNGFMSNGDIDDTDVHQIVADDGVCHPGPECDPRGGITFFVDDPAPGQPALDGPERNKVHDLVVTDSGTDTLYCNPNSPGITTNSVSDLVASPFTDSCDAFDVTGLHELRPTYKDEANRDYRVPNTGSSANSAARAALGDYAERIPGPRTTFYTIP
jgi:hypothetical protein